MDVSLSVSACVHSKLDQMALVLVVSFQIDCGMLEWNCLAFQHFGELVAWQHAEVR